MAHNFKSLRIWQLGLDYSSEIFTLTKTFPKTEKFGLTSQLNRAAISIPSNIAEGTSRDSNLEFAKFLGYSLGSCFEIETQLLIAVKFGYLAGERKNQLLDQIKDLQRMIFTYKEKIKPQPKVQPGSGLTLDS